MRRALTSLRRRVLAATLVVLTLGAMPGCYLSHRRPTDVDADTPRPEDAGPDASIQLDPDTGTQPVEDAGSIVPHTGCRVACEEPALRAIVDATELGDDTDAPRLLVEAKQIDETIVVLATRPHLGHTTPAHRLIFFERATGALRMSEHWDPGGFFPVHHDGARILPSPPGEVRVLTLVGKPELTSGSFPTGNQWVSVHIVTWSMSGELLDDVELSTFPGDPTEACPGGCEAGTTVDGDRVTVSYAPAGQLFAMDIDLAGEPTAGPWEEIATIDDPLRAPWPHTAAVSRGVRWIAGGGTTEFEPPRQAFLISQGSVTPLEGSIHDAQPTLLGGPDLVLTRHVAARSGFVVRRLETAREVRIPTGAGPSPLSSHVSRTQANRVLIAWAGYAPGSFRDTLVTLSPDVPETLCDEVQPATVLRVPEAVSHPSVLAHDVGGTIYLFTLPDDETGRHPQIAVFEIRGCALVP